jgi:hypothetical protein
VAFRRRCRRIQSDANGRRVRRGRGLPDEQSHFALQPQTPRTRSGRPHLFGLRNHHWHGVAPVCGNGPRGFRRRGRRLCSFVANARAPEKNFHVSHAPNGADREEICSDIANDWNEADSQAFITHEGITSQYNTLSGQDLTDAQNAATFACDVYEYFINELDRDSWDDNGGMIPLFIDAQYSSPNAMYGGDCRRMAFSTGWVQLDVIGHEFTHGVVDFTAGLVYSDESGAMNESYADFFGNLIDGAGWLVGEDLPGWRPS